jgi:hypothetical protein
METWEIVGKSTFDDAERRQGLSALTPFLRLAYVDSAGGSGLVSKKKGLLNGQKKDGPRRIGKKGSPHDCRRQKEN